MDGVGVLVIFLLLGVEHNQLLTDYHNTAASPLARTVPDFSRRWRVRLYAIVGLAVACLFIAILALTVGSVRIPFVTVWSILLSHLPFLSLTGDWSSTTDMIIMGIRLPRIMMAGLAGAALGVAGATYQGLFRNPLADPYLIGVAQGAALGAVVGFLLPWGLLGSFLIPVLAFVGALAAVSVVYMIARVGKAVPVTTLILAGVAIGSFLISITSGLTLISADKMPGILSWLIGRFSMSNWDQVKLVAPYIALGLVVIFIFARPLNVMQLDEEQAQQLGINVERTKLILLAASTLITAAAVCFVGTIGFVGIIVPHAVRLIWGPDHRSLLPLSALAGAILLIAADTASRTIMPPTEIPVGVITAFLGAPFFHHPFAAQKESRILGEIVQKLELKDITLSYNHQPVVKDLSFSLTRGELVGLIGPNGCGKTSIIKALSRVLSPCAGKITLDGKELSSISRGDLARQIGVVPQNPSLPDMFTVSEVVLLGRNPHLGLFGSESSKDLTAAIWAMERTGIAPLAGRKIGELSGGERQRVTIARVLAQEPQSILLDEPTANLDICHQIEILDLIKGLCREKNIAVLIALHDLNMAAQFCDRLLLLKEGRIYAEGTPGEVITAVNIKEVYGAENFVYPHPENNLPVVLLSARPNASTESKEKEN